MQDRFKFRIFEYETKEMVELDAIGYSSFDPFAEGKSRLIMVPSGLGNTFHYDKQCLYDNDKFSEPMQCTGLKDKNGKLIYEGDIVKFGEFYDNEWHSFDIGKVYWGGKFDYPAFELQCSTADFDMSNGLSYIFGNGLSIEVIGNIYENKELLEQ